MNAYGERHEPIASPIGDSAMKAKLKSASGFTRFMLAHGEKIGMAAVLTVALLLIWKSLGRESLGPDKQPPNLASKAGEATTHVSQMSWESFPAEERTEAGEDFHPGTVEAPVDRDVQWPPLRPWNDPPIPHAGKRKDPELLRSKNWKLPQARDCGRRPTRRCSNDACWRPSSSSRKPTGRRVRIKNRTWRIAATKADPEGADAGVAAGAGVAETEATNIAAGMVATAR